MRIGTYALRTVRCPHSELCNAERKRHPQACWGRRAKQGGDESGRRLSVRSLRRKTEDAHVCAQCVLAAPVSISRLRVSDRRPETAGGRAQCGGRLLRLVNSPGDHLAISKEFTRELLGSIQGKPNGSI